MNRLDRIFEVPVPSERPLRILAYGFSKTGKSHFVHTATECGPVYWIDTEHGSDFYPPEQGHGFKVLLSKDPTQTIEAIQGAHELAMTGGPRPIVAIDSFSSIWFEQQDVAERLTREWSGGKDRDRAVFRAWGPAKKPLKMMYEMMHRTLCHVIVTARAKEEYEVKPGGEPKLIGTKPDIERNLPYAIDFILEMEVRTAKNAKPKPADFVAIVRGTRTPDEMGDKAIPIGHVFKNPKFSDFLIAEMTGGIPVEIRSSVEHQVSMTLEAPASWNELKERLQRAGLNADEVAKELNTRFGTFNRDLLPEYWDYLKDRIKEGDGQPAEDT